MDHTDGGGWSQVTTLRSAGRIASLHRRWLVSEATTLAYHNMLLLIAVMVLLTAIPVLWLRQPRVTACACQLAEPPQLVPYGREVGSITDARRHVVLILTTRASLASRRACGAIANNVRAVPAAAYTTSQVRRA
jgi:hypothetical protein